MKNRNFCNTDLIEALGFQPDAGNNMVAFVRICDYPTKQHFMEKP